MEKRRFMKENKGYSLNRVDNCACNYSSYDGCFYGYDYDHS